MSIALVFSLWSLRIRPCFTLEGLLETSMLILLLALIRVVSVVSVVSAPMLLAICKQFGGLVQPWVSKSELHQVLRFFLGNTVSQCGHFFLTTIVLLHSRSINQECHFNIF